MGERALLLGLGVTNQAVAAALSRRGVEVVVADDGPTDAIRRAARDLGITLIEQPDHDRYAQLVRDATELVPSPGIGDVHPAFDVAREHGVPVCSELDLAARWDRRPVVAVTGTDGKTTVTTLVTRMLLASGIRAVAAGNNELPLVSAIDDPTTDVFVVEASSFRLAHSQRFAPRVGTWLNFAPDHLDRHRSMASYEEAKARIWRDQTADDVAVGSADDPVVLDHLRRATAQQVTFGLHGDAAFRLDGVRLVGEGAGELATVDELWRAFPHDIVNALAAAATALAAGGTVAGVHDALTAFRGLPHRIELVARHDGISWYDDSKATTPNAAAAAIRSLPSVVLIAGGQNKGLDLAPLAREGDHVRAVVAIGEAADEVVRAFEHVCPTTVATSMAEAVASARDLARPGDSVLLSPACASFDWYKSYAERGDDFAEQVRQLTGATR